MRYLLYARKSSESDDKQAQSIEDQLKDLRALAAQRGLLVVGELTEAKSAKSPGGRPVFAEMVSRLQAGEADAILCWHVNRLFRNPIDFGTIPGCSRRALFERFTLRIRCIAAAITCYSCRSKTAWPTNIYSTSKKPSHGASTAKWTRAGIPTKHPKATRM
ncbi:MAG: recombinase family protein [Abitibacteriaceae bacterium]|nr:recombinase family protein [Abditibacteriaceae bacterium]